MYNQSGNLPRALSDQTLIPETNTTDGGFELNADEPKHEPNRSVFNLIYDNVEDDVDNVSFSSRSYLEEDDLPLPVISDSDSSRWSRCGQCCDCCDTCLRKRWKWFGTCNCGWVKNAFYYITLNVLMFLFFTFVMYMSQVNYNKHPLTPPFEQLTFKEEQFPGLSMVPSMANLEHVGNSIIWYRMKGNNTYQNRRAETYVKLIDNVMYESRKACKSAKPCVFDFDSFGPCKSSGYGYLDKKPCIFLKLNRLTAWIPEEYKRKSEIPEDIPSELLPEIDVISARIWVHCYGTTLYDQEKIGKIEYYPGPYFNASFFPLSQYENTNPMIAIQLVEIQTGYILQLTCAMYAGNVNQAAASHVYVYIKD